MKKVKSKFLTFFIILIAVSMFCGVISSNKERNSPISSSKESETPTLQPTFTKMAARRQVLPPTKIPIASLDAPSSINTPTPELIENPNDELPTVSAMGDYNINIRSGPSTTYKIIDKLTSGESLEVIGRISDSSWWQVSTPEGIGWIAANISMVTGNDNNIPITDIEKALPIPTVVEIKTPTSSPHVVKSMGVSRYEIQSVFESPEIGFTFEEAEKVEGQPRVIGQSANGLAIMELIGPPNNLTYASMTAGIPNDNQKAVLENGIYLMGLLNLTTPEWNGNIDWFNDSLAKLSDRKEIATVYSNLAITLTRYEEFGFIGLTIEAIR